MLTRVLYGDGKNFWFVIDEGEERKSQIYKFIVALTPDEWKKIVRVLDAINTKPMTYMHQEKFKQLEVPRRHPLAPGRWQWTGGRSG